MKGLEWIFGLVCAFCVIFIVLVTSVECVLYVNSDYFEKEYKKYNVTETVDMEMKDLLYVTDEMMSYLRDKRENLDITALINGEKQEFFNPREKAHMVNVKALFVRAEFLRKLFFAAVIAFLLFFMKTGGQHRLFRSFQIATGVFFLCSLVLTAMISTNFNRYFVLFHKIFFNNDLWILNPKTDRLINIVPESFFIDTAARIGIIFITAMLVLCVICTLLIGRGKKAGE